MNKNHHPNLARLLAVAKATADEPAHSIAELDATAKGLQDAEPALAKSVAAGNVNDAAQLTCNRIRLKESIPAERSAAVARVPEALRGLWLTTSEVISQADAIGTEVIKSEGQRLDAAVLPVLQPLLADKTDVSVAHFADLTEAGRRARSLLRDLSSINSDYPVHSMPHLNGQSKEVEVSSAHRHTFKRADRVLAVWTEFLAPVAE